MDVVSIHRQIHPHIGTGMPDMVDLPNTAEHRTCSSISSPPRQHRHLNYIVKNFVGAVKTILAKVAQQVARRHEVPNIT